MHGLINRAIQAFVCHTYGVARWRRVAERAELGFAEYEAMLNVGGVYIQLLQATRDDSPIAKYLAKNGPGLHHLGFGVPDINETLDHLRGEDVRLIDEEPRKGGGGHTVAFVHPKGTAAGGGILVELVDDSDH